MEQESDGWYLQWQKQLLLSGADGLIMEVHYNPEKALCDGHQSLSLAEFAQLMSDLRKVAQAVDRNISVQSLSEDSVIQRDITDEILYISNYYLHLFSFILTLLIISGASPPFSGNLIQKRTQ